MHYLQGRYPVLEKKILAKNMVQYVILCPEIAAAAQPGQFVHILPVGHTLRRPISLCGIDKEKGTICIVFELKGSGTETLAACNVGDCMDVLGPLGHGFTLLPDAKRVVLLGGGIGSCLSWSLMADAIDYNEWKFGVREEGTTYALHSFFRKLAQGIGPSLGLVLATKLGYDASLKAAQTIEVATRMRYLVPVMYLGSYILMIIAYGVVFNLDKKTLAQMESDLKERRAKNEK